MASGILQGDGGLGAKKHSRQVNVQIALPCLKREIFKIIDGQEALESGHGDRDMPIWGETFANSENIDEVMVPKKIYQIIGLKLLD